MHPLSKTELAVLLLPLRWRLKQSTRPIGQHIAIANTKGSPVLKLYRHLCRTEDVDDGSPVGYETYFRVQRKDSDALDLDCGDPYSLVDRLVNVCAIVTGRPMLFTRVIWSSDGFLTADATAGLHFGGMQTDFLDSGGGASVHSGVFQEIRRAWDTADAIWQKQKAGGRLPNALTYFYYAWNSQYLDQTCINLDIVLENLFAPHSAGETTHQICFNISRFLSNSQDERKQLYSFFKKFYSIRSSVVHGGIPDQDQLVTIVRKAFPLVATILKSILLDTQSALIFSDESRRKRLLEDYLFQ
jgi:hypothetical protein